LPAKKKGQGTGFDPAPKYILAGYSAAALRARAFFLPVLFHYGASRDFFGAFAITTGALRRSFDVLVLTLFLRACAF